MSDLGGPHGRSLGMMKVTAKTDLGDKWSVVFTSEKGSANFLMSKGEAEYFQLDGSYHFFASTP